jgi:PAS domain S-box-containing protein
MNSSKDPLHTRVRALAFAASLTAMFVSAAVLSGWTPRIPWLTGLFSGFIVMKPVTALCFFLSGFSLSLLAPESSLTVARRRLAQVSAFLVTLIGIATTIEFATDYNLGFEGLLSRLALYATGVPNASRLSLASAIAFIFLGIALVFLDLETSRGARPVQLLAIGVLFFALINVLAYLYSADDLNRVLRLDSMATHTALLLLLLSLGAIAARPDRGPLAVFFGSGIVSPMARRVLVAAILLTVATGWIQLIGERRGLYGAGLGLALLTSANIAMFSALIAFSARSVATSLEKLDASNRDLVAATKELAERTNLRLAAIIESSDDAIIGKTLDGTITSWNAGAERIFGYSAAEAIGESMRMLLPPDRFNEEADILRRVARGEFVNHFESVRIGKHGKSILLSITISPVRDASGAIIGASKIARDITKTRRIEQSVQEHEARLAAIIGAATDGVITVDEGQLITMFNPAAEAMFGCRASEVLGSSIDRLIPARFRPEHAQHVRAFGQTQITRRPMGRAGSLYGLRSTGEEFPIEASISQTEVQGQKLFTVILRDVTGRKLAEDELRQHAILLDLAPILVRDLDNRIVLWTRGAQQLYGYSKEEAIGRISLELLQTQFLVPAQQITDALERFGTWEGQLQHRTSDGRTVFVASQWVLHHDASGKPARILEVSSDLTELKRVQTLQLRSQKLESLGTLAGGVAHDFNNILLAINGNTKLALEDLPADHPACQNLSEIAKAGARAADLVRRILAFSRPQDQERKPQPVQPVVEEALELVRATLPASIHIDCSFSSDLPLVALDSTQLHQVIVNLATNASHAIGDKPGTITLRLDSRTLLAADRLAVPEVHEGRYVCLTVSDDGCGMDRATLDRVFDPFFTTKSVGQGTGLGLSVVHGIVSSHGGAITAYSQPGYGTSFVLYFPAVETSTNATAPIQAPAQPVERGRHENILYVDDEEGLVMLGTLFLQRLGYEVTGHVDAAAALYDFRSRPDHFAAVVTDLSMPRMSGFDLARQLLNLRPALPILMTSGYVRPEDRRAAETLGIARIIVKPSTMDQLGQALADVLHRKGTPVKAL